MNWLDKIFMFMQRICVTHYARLVECCIALTLIGLALYITDPRVIAYRLVLEPKGIPARVCGAILIATGVAQIFGVFMPLVHRWFANRGFKNRWLTQKWMNERTWRITAMAMAIAMWGAYAGVMSAISWAAWLFAGSFSVLLTASIFRLEAMRDADRADTPMESITEHDIRLPRDDGPIHRANVVEVEARAQIATAARQHGAKPISYQANRERTSTAT